MPPQPSALSPAISSLLHKRLLFFIGKGGVGKTTVATSVALASARVGKKTLLIELDENARALRLLGQPAQPTPATEPYSVSPSLFVLSTSGGIALEEYLRLIIPLSPLRRAIVESRAYQYFVAAAPGLKELLTMGKVWYEERKQDTHTQQPVWDMIIVDLPATGHSLQYLRMPHAARTTFGGVVGYEAERILTLLRDIQKTAINLVTTADELAVSETIDTYHRLVHDLQFPLGTLFINRTHFAPLSPHELGQVKITSRLSPPERHLATLALKYAHTEATLAVIQTENLHPLAELSLPRFHLPFCGGATFDVATVERLATVIYPPAPIVATVSKPHDKPRKGKRASSQRP